MTIVDFTPSHIPAASALALADYREQQRRLPALPAVEEGLDLTPFAAVGLGVTAFEGGRMVGFLSVGPPFDNAFGSTRCRGVFSPMGAHAAAPERRGPVYAAMYQRAAAKWVRAGALSHAVALYAQGEEAQRQFFQYGFGLRCVDAIRPMEPIDCPPPKGYSFFELPPAQFSSVYPFEELLDRHFRESPTFMARPLESCDAFCRSCAAEGDRCFAAAFQGRLCAYLKLSAKGETFLSPSPRYRHITGAFCLGEHRGKGVVQTLLNCAIRSLKGEGCTHLGVDFESINPAAHAFWCKYFSPYTHGLVRRVDERILDPLPF